MVVMLWPLVIRCMLVPWYESDLNTAASLVVPVHLLSESKRSPFHVNIASGSRSNKFSFFTTLRMVV